VFAHNHNNFLVLRDSKLHAWQIVSKLDGENVRKKKKGKEEKKYPKQKLSVAQFPDRKAAHPNASVDWSCGRSWLLAAS
jgi:hypothetical protein